MPQMIFLNSLFGYLSLLIIIKWCTGSQADLYHVMIYMFLSPFDDLGDNELFWGQRPLQVHLIISLLLIPHNLTGGDKMAGLGNGLKWVNFFWFNIEMGWAELTHKPVFIINK